MSSTERRSWVLGPTPGSLPTGSGARNDRLCARRHDSQAVRLIEVGRYLRDRLTGADSNRDRQAEFTPDSLLETARDNLGRQLVSDLVGYVEIRLVERERLNKGRDIVEDVHHLPGDLPVPTEARADSSEAWADFESGTHGHRRTNAIFPSLVRCGSNHTPGLRTAAHRERLAPEFRIIELFHRSVEGVEVCVKYVAHKFRPLPQPSEFGPNFAGNLGSLLNTCSIYLYYYMRAVAKFKLQQLTYRTPV